MKTTLTIIFIVFGVITKSQNCCPKPTPTEKFSSLTTDSNFVATHLEPNSFTLENKLGKNITFKTADGNIGYAYEIKSEKPSNNYVFVIHEWWGLNDYIKQESEKIYKTLGNVNVIAIDLYDQKVATTRDSASKYMQSVKTIRAENIIKGALSYVGKNSKIATLGWCFGGGWSLQSTLLSGKQSKACVMYYGMPEDKNDKLKKLNAPVLFIWPEQDQWINKEVVEKFRTNMKAAKKDLDVQNYNADHAFANPSNPKFNKEFADDAFKKAMEFIKLNLK